MLQFGAICALSNVIQLERLDCGIDFFSFKGLRKADGSAVTDLNDCIELAPEQLHQLEELFP